MRNATLAERHRKNSLFEQERAASRDYDKQRSGGTPSKPAKSSSGASKPKEEGKSKSSE